MRHRDGSIPCEQAIAEDFSYGPHAGASVPLQANFAFTKAYLAEASGIDAGFVGPRFFLDMAFCENTPAWCHLGKRVEWAVEVMSGNLCEVLAINSAAAAPSGYSDRRFHLAEPSLPVILTYASDGTYAAAMSSRDDIENFVEYLTHQFDNSAANMDW